MKQKRFSMMGRPRRLGEAEIARILASQSNDAAGAGTRTQRLRIDGA